MACWQRMPSCVLWWCRRGQPSKSRRFPKASAQGAMPRPAIHGLAASGHSRPGRITWARLLKRVFDIDMHRCPNCGDGDLKIIAAILERPVIEKILTHLGLDPQPPPRGRAREVGQDFAT